LCGGGGEKWHRKSVRQRLQEKPLQAQGRLGNNDRMKKVNASTRCKEKCLATPLGDDELPRDYKQEGLTQNSLKRVYKGKESWGRGKGYRCWWGF